VSHSGAAHLGPRGFYRSRTAFPLLLMPKCVLIHVRAVRGSTCLEKSVLSPCRCLRAANYIPSQADAYYRYDQAELQALQQQRPWSKDPAYFKKCA